jgi:hypothetical protein
MSQWQVESLEKRALLSAALVNGVITVEGTTAADRITVVQDQTGITVVTNGSTEAGSPFAGASGIAISGLAGGDTINIDSSVATTFAVSVYGGAGPDSITANSGHGELHGGRGRDDIEIDGAAAYLLAGAKGADTLVADNGTGNAIIRGGAGSDSIAYGNDNTLQTITGGPGANSIVGSNGSDTILSTSGIDNIVASVRASALILDTAGGSSITGHFTGDPGADTIYTVGSTFSVIPGGGDQLNPGGATAPANEAALINFLNTATDPAQLPPP